MPRHGGGGHRVAGQHVERCGVDDALEHPRPQHHAVQSEVLLRQQAEHLPPAPALARKQLEAVRRVLQEREGGAGLLRGLALGQGRAPALPEVPHGPGLPAEGALVQVALEVLKVEQEGGQGGICEGGPGAAPRGLGGRGGQHVVRQPHPLLHRLEVFPQPPFADGVRREELQDRVDVGRVEKPPGGLPARPPLAHRDDELEPLGAPFQDVALVLLLAGQQLEGGQGLQADVGHEEVLVLVAVLPDGSRARRVHLVAQKLGILLKLLHEVLLLHGRQLGGKPVHARRSGGLRVAVGLKGGGRAVGLRSGRGRPGRALAGLAGREGLLRRGRQRGHAVGLLGAGNHGRMDAHLPARLKLRHAHEVGHVGLGVDGGRDGPPHGLGLHQVLHQDPQHVHLVGERQSLQPRRLFERPGDVQQALLLLVRGLDDHVVEGGHGGPAEGGLERWHFVVLLREAQLAAQQVLGGLPGEGEEVGLLLVRLGRRLHAVDEPLQHVIGLVHAERAEVQVEAHGHEQPPQHLVPTVAEDPSRGLEHVHGGGVRQLPRAPA
mmetsp:Transcript_17940/g.50556  ORF Transcript_17940/g.50556 Transcript_17940/m.50556 type:complete len:548 (-) Transcript_17940:607-2250(-)